jgi:hypothetical protein
VPYCTLLAECNTAGAAHPSRYVLGSLRLIIERIFQPSRRYAFQARRIVFNVTRRLRVLLQRLVPNHPIEQIAVENARSIYRGLRHMSAYTAHAARGVNLNSRKHLNDLFTVGPSA